MAQRTMGRSRRFRPKRLGKPDVPKITYIGGKGTKKSRGKKPVKSQCVEYTGIPLESYGMVVMDYGISGQILVTTSTGWQWVDLEEHRLSKLTEQEPLTTQQEQSNKKIMELKTVLGKKFINVDEVAEILEIGFLTNKNVFLYGRGGHAKSEIIEEFLRHIDPEGNESFVQACGEGLSEEKLFGGLDLSKFQKSGEIEYLVENSFMSKKYVVFEELLDSRMNVLLSLKDILTSGIFRQGKQQFKIRTQFVICLTNRTKQEVAEDNSIKALLERFPLEMKVEWAKYEMSDYKAMFSKVLKNNHEKVATICQSINECGDFVSPRTAIHMAQVYQTTGRLTDLKYFGATREVIEKVEKLEKEQKQKKFIDQKSAEYDKIISGECDCIDEYKKASKKIKTLLTEITALSYVDKVFNDFTTLKSKIDAKIKEYQSGMLNIIENE